MKLLVYHARAEAYRALLRERFPDLDVATVVAGADEAVAITRFDVAPWAGTGSGIEILYPLAALRSVEPELAARRLGFVGGVTRRECLAGRWRGWRRRRRSVVAESCAGRYSR